MRQEQFLFAGLPVPGSIDVVFHHHGFDVFFWEGHSEENQADYRNWVENT